MLKINLLLLTFFLLGSCYTIKKDSKMNGQFTYVEKESLWRVKTYKGDEDKSPKLSKKTLTVIKDSVTTVTHTTKEKFKRKMGGFFLVTTSENSKKSKKANPKYKPSYFIMEGTFQQPESSGSFRYQNEKIVFNTDGTCVHYWKTTCSDSPCGSDHQQMGIYKIRSDTVYIVYYLGKTITTYYPRRDIPKVNIDDLKWEVKPLVETNYLLNKKHDSLQMITENGKSIRNGIILLPKDSIMFMNNNTKSREIVIEKKSAAERKYYILIREGDIAFNEKNWDEAYVRYSEAIQNKPNEDYPKQKINEIKMIKRDEKVQFEEDYQKLIKKADEYFDNKNYDKALELYNRAASIKSNDVSVKTKIDDCKSRIEKNKK